MNKLFSSIFVAALVAALPAAAQKVNSTGGNSPHETTSARIDRTVMVTITYGRPSIKGRTVWGGKLAPWDAAWRMGSDEATTLITQQPLAFGDVTIPAGAYTLYMIPSEKGSKLTISKTIGAWGIPVDEKHDLARVDLKQESLDTPVEELTLAVQPNPAGGGAIVLKWDKSQYSAAFTVKK